MWKKILATVLVLIILSAGAAFAAGKQDVSANVDAIAAKTHPDQRLHPDNPETGNKEFKAVELLTKTLQDNGFKVETGVAGLKTAFVATYANTSGRPRHRLPLRIRRPRQTRPRLRPQHHRRRRRRRRIALAKASATSPPPSSSTAPPPKKPPAANCPGRRRPLRQARRRPHDPPRRAPPRAKSLALNLIDFTFEGKAPMPPPRPKRHQRPRRRHDALKRHRILREHVRSDVRIHGIVTDGGAAANIVPERASARFYVRSATATTSTPSSSASQRSQRRGHDHGTKVTIKQIKAYDNKVILESLSELLLENAKALGAKQILPPPESTASTDFGSVTYRVPGAELGIAFVPVGTPGHSQAYVQAGTTPAGHEAVITAAKVLAASGYDLITNPELLQKSKPNSPPTKTPQNNNPLAPAEKFSPRRRTRRTPRLRQHQPPHLQRHAPPSPRKG
jgi:metal-dependent amidase/aminoacylase/carboxypeptidase family protein